MTYRAILQGHARDGGADRVRRSRAPGKSKMSRKIFLEAIGVVWKLRADGMRGRL